MCAASKSAMALSSASPLWSARIDKIMAVMSSKDDELTPDQHVVNRWRWCRRLEKWRPTKPAFSLPLFETPGGLTAGRFSLPASADSP